MTDERLGEGSAPRSQLLGSATQPSEIPLETRPQTLATDSRRRSAGLVQRKSSLAALALYVLLALLLLHPDQNIQTHVIGGGADSQSFIWCLSWWPWAISHGVNPLVSKFVWYPLGFPLLWQRRSQRARCCAYRSLCWPAPSPPSTPYRCRGRRSQRGRHTCLRGSSDAGFRHPCSVASCSGFRLTSSGNCSDTLISTRSISCP